MTPPGTPARRRHRLLDPRLAIGVLLVAGSVVGVVAIVGAAGASVTVYAASRTLTAGDTVDGGDLVPRAVRPDSIDGRYLTDAALDEGAVVTRTVGAGELVPLSAVGTADDVDTASIVVQQAGALPRAVEPGAVVDVWSAAELAEGGYGPPAVLVDGAVVVRVVEDGGLVGGTDDAGVELLVPRDRLARVLQAIAAGESMSLVPLSAGRG
jgi:hypothetical protein